MTLKEIQSLIKFVSTSGVDEVAIEQEAFKLTIKKNPSQISANSIPHQVVVETPQVLTAAPAASPTSAPEAAPSANTAEIKSPMIGTFYRRPSPDKPNFVEVGDMIEKGQVICIIEAMKLFNEIEAETSGKVVKVLLDDSSPVEYDQPLFLIEPS